MTLRHRARTKPTLGDQRSGPVARGAAPKEPPGNTCPPVGWWWQLTQNQPRGLTAKLPAVFVVDTNETELTIPFGN
jgi:hypothetical protein